MDGGATAMTKQLCDGESGRGQEHVQRALRLDKLLLEPQFSGNLLS